MANPPSVLVLFCVIAFVSALPYESEVDRGLRLLQNTYEKCEASGELIPCLKIKVVKLADRALKINNIPLFEGVTVIKSEDAGAREFSEPDFQEESLPQDATARDDALDDLLIERVARFFKSHSLQFSLPKLLGGQDDDTEEGRGKYKKYMGPMMLAAMAKGGLFIYAMKMVGLLALKALFVGKIALVLAAVVGLKKLFSSGGGAESKTIEIVQKPQVSHTHSFSGHDFGGIGGQGAGGWETSGHGGSSGGGGGGYSRNYDAQDLAYQGRDF